MNSVSKMLIIGGVIMIAAGLVWHFGSKILPLGRLPGDIVVEKENFKFYFPIMTSILLSLGLSLVFYLFKHFK